MATTIYGCDNPATGQVDFDICDTADYSACFEVTGEHAGQVKLVLSGTYCDDTYYGCYNNTTGKYEVIVPDDCCSLSGYVCFSGLSLCGCASNIFSFEDYVDCLNGKCFPHGLSTEQPCDGETLVWNEAGCTGESSLYSGCQNHLVVSTSYGGGVLTIQAYCDDGGALDECFFYGTEETDLSADVEVSNELVCGVGCLGEGGIVACNSGTATYYI